MGTSFDTAQSLEVERDLSSTTWLMLACAAFVLLGIWFVASPETFADMPLARAIGFVSPTTIVITLGVVAIALGGFGGVAWSRHARAGGPALRLDPRGLSVLVGPVTVVDLPWREVTGTQFVTIARTKMLGILVADVARVLEGQSVTARAIGKMNASTFGTPLYVGANMVTMDLRELADAIEAYCTAHSGR